MKQPPAPLRRYGDTQMGRLVPKNAIAAPCIAYSRPLASPLPAPWHHRAVLVPSRSI
jgi:hypothetical protein